MKMMTDEQLRNAAECLKVLAHPVRLKLIQRLIVDKFTVTELAKECDIRQHVASEHLRLLQRCGLLNSRKEGRRVYYDLAQKELINLMSLIEAKFGQ